MAASRRPVVVLFGGPSAEHDVSIVSGTAITEALRDAGWAVTPWLIDLDGAWWRLPADHRRDGRPGSAYDDPAGIGGEGPRTAGAVLDELAAMSTSPVLWVALHGPWGEDGRVQGLLEASGLVYTGSGVAASALGMDKALFKRLLSGVGVPLAPWREIRRDRWERDRDGVLAELDGFARGNDDPRLMVKPARLGSSVGMMLAHHPEERPAALDLAFRYDTLALAERYLAGARDLEVAVIGNDPARLELYGPGEIIAGHEFYDFAAKYTPGLSETSTRAEVPEPVRAAMLKLARDTYRAIGAEGFARVDFLLVGDDIYVSEINTIPGFTPISLFPTMPEEGGYTFTSVCERIIELALDRDAARVERRLVPEDLPR